MRKEMKGFAAVLLALFILASPAVFAVGALQIGQAHTGAGQEEGVGLAFRAERCDDTLDAYNPENAGVKETTWLDDTTLEVVAYVSTNCAKNVESGDYSIEGSNITLRYYSPKCIVGELCTSCYCLSRVVYRFTDLQREEYAFALESSETPLEETEEDEVDEEEQEEEEDADGETTDEEIQETGEWGNN